MQPEFQIGDRLTINFSKLDVFYVFDRFGKDKSLRTLILRNLIRHWQESKLKALDMYIKYNWDSNEFCKSCPDVEQWVTGKRRIMRKVHDGGKVFIRKFMETVDCAETMTIIGIELCSAFLSDTTSAHEIYLKGREYWNYKVLIRGTNENVIYIWLSGNSISKLS